MHMHSYHIRLWRVRMKTATNMTTANNDQNLQSHPAKKRVRDGRKKRERGSLKKLWRPGQLASGAYGLTDRNEEE